MAGKIAALANRLYIKGRDWYDLMWYFSRRPPVQPNLTLLHHAIIQTEKKPWEAADWKNRLFAKITSMDWEKLHADVIPFLERPEEAELLTPDLFGSILRPD